MKKKKSKAERRSTTSPVRKLSQELTMLRRDLRTTVRAFAARLEIELAESMAAIAANSVAEDLAAEELHQIRDLTALVRHRKLKPEKGRRKDLRKLEGIIDELHSSTHPVAPR